MSLPAPYTIEFPFRRTVGPKIGTFLAGLREARLFGVRTARGVLCPPLEFDPVSGAATGDLVELEPVGTVTAWTWVPARPGDPVEHDFAWALIAIDGTVGAFFHCVDVGGEKDQIKTGLRVRARWRPERGGDLRDLWCFEPDHAGADHAGADRAGADRAGADHARADRAEADRAGAVS